MTQESKKLYNFVRTFRAYQDRIIRRERSRASSSHRVSLSTIMAKEVSIYEGQTTTKTAKTT